MIQNLIANRLGGIEFGQKTEIYKFEKIKIAKRQFLTKNPHKKLLDFGVGESDQKPNQAIIDQLYKSAKNLKKHGYTDTGTPAFKQAASRFYNDLFKVKNLDPKKNILPTIGSKEALANLPKCFINQKDIVLQTTPGYPILATNTRYLGGEVYNLPLLEKNNFYPDFSIIPSNILQKAKILVLNYPNNPTGKCANKEFFQTAIDFALKHNIIIISDNAYATIVFDRSPLSILQFPGSEKCALELFSFSKGFSMTGWRLGFAVGNELLIKLLSTIKDNTDSGSFEAIQQAGILALEKAKIFTQEINQRFQRRMNLLVTTLNQIGFEATLPEGTFFLFMKSPRQLGNKKFKKAEEIAKFLIEEKGIVCVPWDDHENYLRFSATFEAQNETEEKAVMQDLKERLEGLQIRF